MTALPPPAMAAVPPSAMTAVPPAGPHPPPAPCLQRARKKPGKLRRWFSALLPGFLFILAWSLPGLIPACAGLAWLCGAGR